MNKLKPFIEEKPFDRSARAFLLLIGVVALAASICSPFLILRFIFALVAPMPLYFIPVWLPSKFLIREQRGTKMGLHPIAWALWQSIYCFVSIIYLKIIEVSDHVAFSSMPFALIVAAGAGYLVSFGEEFILEERLKSSVQIHACFNAPIVSVSFFNNRLWASSSFDGDLHREIILRLC